MADVDGDGRLDAIASHFDELVIGVYRQLAIGGLAPEETHTSAQPQQYTAGPQLTATTLIFGKAMVLFALVAFAFGLSGVKKLIRAL